MDRFLVFDSLGSGGYVLWCRLAVWPPGLLCVLQGCLLRAGCSLGAVDDILNGNYEKLAGLLEGREDWQPGIQDGERYWYFGVDGAARLVITPEMDGFLMYRSDQDVSWVIPRIESVGEWLDEHEHEHAGLTSLQEEFKRHLGQEEPGPQKD